MKNKMKLWTLLLMLAVFALTGCGGKKDEAADAAQSSEELVEYTAEGVGTFQLPDGFEMETGESTEGLPYKYALFTKGEVTIYASRFGLDAYEQAGVELPADLQEYSERAGVRQSLPEEVADAKFEEDEYGNLFMQYTDEGEHVLYVLKKGTDAYGAVTVYWPEDSETDYSADAAIWAGKAVLE